MKRPLSLFVAVLLFFTANAQIKIGLRFAPQITWGSSDSKTASSDGSRVNVAYGLLIDYYMTPNYGIGTEICVNTYGINLSINHNKFKQIKTEENPTVYPSTEDLKYDYRLQYIQIPVLLKMRTNEIGDIRYFAEIGFGLGFLTRARADVSMGNFAINNINVNDPDNSDKFTIEPTSSTDLNYSGAVSYFRTSFIFGAGIQKTLAGNATLVAGLRYDSGYTSFTSDDRLSTSLNYIAANIGFLF